MSDLIEMLKRHEGEKLKPYKCTAGKNTIGVGWNMDANPLPKDIADYLEEHGCITQEMSDRLLSISIDISRRSCYGLFPKFLDFSENRKNALIDWVFNVGVGTAKTFVNTLAAINSGRWDDAAKGLRNSKWYKQVDKVPDNHKERGDEIIDLIKEG